MKAENGIGIDAVHQAGYHFALGRTGGNEARNATPASGAGCTISISTFESPSSPITQTGTQWATSPYPAVAPQTFLPFASHRE